MRILSHSSLEFSKIMAGVVLAALVVFVFFMVASSITLVCRPSMVPAPRLSHCRGRASNATTNARRYVGTRTYLVKPKVDII